MIPSASTIDRQTNMVAEESIEMSIDTTSLRFLMNTLSNLYSNRELAVIRELSTNARDAMIAAGRADVPIKVQLPNQFRQLLTISDTGIGMDVEDLRNTYSRYGASNKRNSNDFNGVLGLGSKSPFTITDQYTVIAVKNGIKTSVIVSRSAEGGGTMEVISQIPTDEHNGVEIQIPTKRNVDWRELAREFFKWWEKGAVLVDGREPEYFKGDKLTDKIYLDYEYDYYGKDYIIMGGVAYPLADRMNHSYKVMYFADNGEIDFVPSREAVDYTFKTKQVIAKVEAEVESKVKADLEFKIKNLSSIKEAVTFFDGTSQILSDLRMLPFTYNGKQFVHNISMTHILYRKGYNAEKRWAIDIANAVKTDANIVETQITKISAQMKQKMAKYAADNGLVDRWIITTKPINDFWLTDLKRVSWDDLKAVKLPKQANSAPAQKRGAVPEYAVFNGGYYFDSAVKLDTTRPIYYMTPSDMTADGARVYRHILESDAQIARVYKVKEKAFKLAFPTAKHLYEVGKEYAQGWLDVLVDQDYVDYNWYNHGRVWVTLGKLSDRRSEVLDSDIFKEYDRIKQAEGSTKKYEYGRAIFNTLPYEQAPKFKNAPDARIIDFFADYPMIKHTVEYRAISDNIGITEYIDYINYKFTNNKEKK